jgi:hypothetical protein
MLRSGFVCRHCSKAPRSKKHQLNFSAQETIQVYDYASFFAASDSLTPHFTPHKNQGY